MAAAQQAALTAFAENCFSPFLTAETARTKIAGPGIRLDFYDLEPFSAAAPSPVTGRAATAGTDRRCEVAFDGDSGPIAANTAVTALAAEGIETEAALPKTHADAAIAGTTLLAARRLNPNRVAVVHTGTRRGPNGAETFLMVERLTPEASRR
ncbi:succinyl-CoA synthetase subunit beta [Actibacterium sp. 188UL27-1]|nr:succinyl-CoA synthetase subunit beta [Actibacterium sp. 188UL27-1]